MKTKPTKSKTTEILHSSDLVAAFEAAKAGACAPFCGCGKIAGYIILDWKKAQVVVDVSKDRKNWL